MEHFQQYINGKFENGTAKMDCINPATNTVWASVARANTDDVNRAVSSAKYAFENTWSQMLPTQRKTYMFKLADLIEQNVQRLAEIETRDTGKIIRETKSQIAYIAQYYRYYAELTDKIQGKIVPIDKPHMQVTIHREPIGVVVAIIPWNSQLFLSAIKLAPGLASGCTFVVKASEIAPAFLLEFAKLIDKAGFPKGVVNIISGYAQDCAKPLTKHPNIAKIAFTGGPKTAKHIVSNSSHNLAKVSLELGGKSPFIVCDDADIKSAVNAQIAGIFAASGQSCVAGSRLIVSQDIKKTFLDTLIQQAQKIVIGCPEKMETEFGPLCTPQQLEKIDTIVQNSIKQGAKLLLGGKPMDGKGFYYPPTILDCSASQHAECVVQELFGPVLSVLTFKTEQQAITLANDTEYGLACGIFTKDLTRAHRMSKAIKSGIVWMNTYRAISPMAPIGGYGLSGHGREGGLDAVLEYTTTKTVWLRTSDDAILDPFVMR